MNKGVLILRTSKDNQETKQQLKDCQEYIEEKGINIILTLEAQESAYKNSYIEREQTQQVMSMARNGQIDCVVAWKTDRLARDMDAISFFSCLMANNVAYHSVMEGGLQGTNLIDKFMLAVRLFQGEQESENGSKRIKSKLRELNARGVYIQGGVPYGVDIIDTGVVRNNAKGTTQKELQLNPDKSIVIKEIYDLYLLKNYGCQRIANYLNNKGIPTPGGGRIWRSNTVRNILTNQAYTGKLRYNTKCHENPKDKKYAILPKSEWKFKDFPHLRIISDEDFNAVQLLLDKKNTKKNCVPTKSDTHLFSGLLKCGYCGESIYANSSNSKNGKKRYHYNCRGTLNDVHGHEQTAYSRNKLDSSLEESIMEVIDRIEYKDLSKYRGINVKQEMESLQAKLVKIMEEISDKEEERSGINKEIRKSIIGKSEYTKDQLAAILDDITTETETLLAKESEIKELIKTEEQKLYSENTFNEAIHKWSEVYKLASFDEKKALLSKIIDNIVLKKGIADINFKIALPKVYGECTTNNSELHGEHTILVEFSEKAML